MLMNDTALLTGVTGYIGGRLLRHFEEAGRPIRCLARQPAQVHKTKSNTEVVQGDCLDEASLDRALAGVQDTSRKDGAVAALIPDGERPLCARRPGRQCAVLNTHDLADLVASDYGEDSASVQRSSVSRLRRSFKEDREFRAIRNHLLPGGSRR